MEEKIKLGISSCLLGNKVRYDGGHKFDPFLVNTLGQFVDYVPVCPEVESGFPVPREAFRLVGDPEKPRLVTRQSGVDATPQMERWIEKKLPQLEKESLCGFIFKSQSPSSGMERVKVYNDKGMAEKKGVGIFARALMAAPAAAAGGGGRPPAGHRPARELHRAHLRLPPLAGAPGRRAPRPGAWSISSAGTSCCSWPTARRWPASSGSWWPAPGTRPLAEILPEYEKLLLTALKQKATVRKNVNVLQHMFGYFKKQLDDFEKKEMLATIENYRQNLMPLIVPLTLLKHYIDKFQEPYLRTSIISTRTRWS